MTWLLWLSGVADRLEPGVDLLWVPWKRAHRFPAKSDHASEHGFNGLRISLGFIKKTPGPSKRRFIGPQLWSKFGHRSAPPRMVNVGHTVRVRFANGSRLAGGQK